VQHSERDSGITDLVAPAHIETNPAPYSPPSRAGAVRCRGNPELSGWPRNYIYVRPSHRTRRTPAMLAGRRGRSSGLAVSMSDREMCSGRWSRSYRPLCSRRYSPGTSSGANFRPFFVCVPTSLRADIRARLRGAPRSERYTAASPPDPFADGHCPAPRPDPAWLHVLGHHAAGTRDGMSPTSSRSLRSARGSPGWGIPQLGLAPLATRLRPPNCGLRPRGIPRPAR
jgi:hypothetical protein